MLFALLAGCGQKEDTSVLDEKESELRRMQERLVEVQQSSSSKIGKLERQLADAKQEVIDEASQQTKLIQLLRAQVERLREENRKLLLENSRSASTDPVPPKPPAPAFAQLDAAVDIAAEPKPAFPVKVTQLEGRRVITGTHEISKFVANEETFKDRFGRIRQDGEWVDQPVNQYGYEIIYSLINESDKTIQLTARAGLASDSMTLDPGETRINARLVAARGSGLWLLSDGKSLKLDVEYAEEEK